MLTTFGGSGSLLACRLVDILDLAGVVVPQNPGNVSAFGLLTVDVKNDYVQTHVARHTSARPRRRREDPRRADRQGRRGARRRGLRRARTTSTSAPSTCATSARPTRSASPPGPAGSTRRSPTAVADRFHDEHRQLYGYDFRHDPTQQVEWVNLRVTGVGPITRPELLEIPSRVPHRPGTEAPGEACAAVLARGLLRRRGRPRHDRRLLAPRPAGRRHLQPAPRSSRSSARPSRSTPASPSASTRSATSSSPRRPDHVRPQHPPRHRARRHLGQRPGRRRRHPQPRRPAHGIRARQPADAARAARSTRSSSRSSRAPSRASRWRSRPPSRAPRAPR